MAYITTDPNSEFLLVSGRRYFMDFDISSIPQDIKDVLPLESMKYKFISEMRDRGYDPGIVSVRVPARDVVRITFTANSPPLLILIAIAVGIILMAAGTGAGIFVGFMGLGEAVPELANLPAKLTEAAVKNPIAVIAIIVAIGIFIIGIKL